MKLTFVDSGVLIAAARGDGDLAQRAFEILDDPERCFASSMYVKLEVLPKPLYFNNKDEVEFYEVFFSNVAKWIDKNSNLLEKAYNEAVKVGLSALDAIHVASAAAVSADELITTEKNTKPIHQTKLITVRSINPKAI